MHDVLRVDVEEHTRHQSNLTKPNCSLEEALGGGVIQCLYDFNWDATNCKPRNVSYLQQPFKPDTIECFIEVSEIVVYDMARVEVYPYNMSG